ncbi:hypothetical protein [Embleya sp. NPDC005971]|uniref:hypothetical protein n=1 Tax=Embleya sp. NPDC005971 TaxID=3156724 RepID=UPI0033D1E1B1
MNKVTHRLTEACRALRVPHTDLVDAVCALSWRPPPPAGPHPVRRLYEQVLQAVGELPLGTVQPGDVSAAMEVRTGALDVQVPPPSDAVALCIAHTVDDLGVLDLDELVRNALTRGELACGAATVTRERASCTASDAPGEHSSRAASKSPHGPDPADCGTLDRLAAGILVDEITERPPQSWGRPHTDAIRAATYRSLADLADALLEVSESTPTPLDWEFDATGRRQRAGVDLGGIRYTVFVHRDDAAPREDATDRHHPPLPTLRAGWMWRLDAGSPDGSPDGCPSHGCGPYPSAPAARHAAECAITALAAGRCHP